MLKKKSLFDRVAENILKKAEVAAEIDSLVSDMKDFLGKETKEASMEKVADGETKSDRKDKFKGLDEYERELLEFCETPRTYSHMKQFFHARDKNNKTIDIDNKIYKLVKEGFLDHKSYVYATNPKFREFITVIPMTAAKKDAMDYETKTPEEYTIKAIAYGLDDPTIINALVDKYNLDHSYAYDMIQSIKAQKEGKIIDTWYEKEPSNGDLGGGLIDRTEREEYRESLIATKSFRIYNENKGELKKKSDIEICSTKYEWNGTDLIDYETQTKVDFSALKEGDLVLDYPYIELEEGTLSIRDTIPSDLYAEEIGIDRDTWAPMLRIFKASTLKKKDATRKKANKQAASYINSINNNFKLNAQNVAHQAVVFTRKFLSNYRFPLAPQIKFNAIKNASTDNNLLNGEVNLTLEFRTLSGVKKYIDISVPVKEGNFIEPSTMTVNGQSYIISQSAVDDLTNHGTFYAKVNPKGMFTNPMNRNVTDSFKDKKVPKIKRNLFSF